MGNNDQAISDLRAARATLLKMRRDWAGAISAGYAKGKTEDGLVKFVEVQNTIEAIDRAIRDEKGSP
jgi:hypothetical protein